MKNLIVTLLSGILICRSGLVAYDDKGVYGSESIENYTAASSDEKRPFGISVSGDTIFHSRFDEKPIKKEHLTYGQLDVEASAVFYYNECYSEGAAIAVDYELNRLHWKENPFFHQQDFHQIGLSLSFFSSRLCDWLWLGQAGFFINAEHLNFNEYAYYDFLGWGRYSYNSCLGIHVGIVGEVGMKMDHVYPIIGVDWMISDCWKLNVVYPMNISLVYGVNENLSFAIAARFFDKRQRADNDAPRPKSLWNYRTTGIELAMDFERDDWLLANVHVGYTLGGRLKIADRHNDEKFHLDLNPAPYIGGKLSIRF